MVASSWTLQVEPDSKEEIAIWLGAETTAHFNMVLDNDTMLVQLNSIDDAFRFRMQFDEQIKTI